MAGAGVSVAADIARKFAAGYLGDCATGEAPRLDLADYIEEAIVQALDAAVASIEALPLPLGRRSEKFAFYRDMMSQRIRALKAGS